MENLSRRDFINLLGFGIGGAGYLALPSYIKFETDLSMTDPLLRTDDLPVEIQDILKLVNPTEFNKDGYLLLHSEVESKPSFVPLAITDWNKEHRYSSDRLLTDQPLGIVLHWYGDRENYDNSLDGYLRGFNSIRPVSDYETNTSAHFLIGSAEAIPSDQFKKSSRIGIIQTQSPDTDGTPFVASHLARMDYEVHEQALQYFVRASYFLNQSEDYPLSILVDFYDGRKIDPNMRTIAIEITGWNFDKLLGEIDHQKLANVVSVVIAVMKKHKIPALNILGHNEISLNKADPGKMFLATIRLLIGVQCLLSDDYLVQQLVLAPFYSQNTIENSYALTQKLNKDKELFLDTKKQALINYLKYIRSYLLLVDTPANVYHWETISKYWVIYDLLVPKERPQAIANDFLFPIKYANFESRGCFLDSTNREGVNYYLNESDSALTDHCSINLIANGKCIYVGNSELYPNNFITIFKHRLSSSAEVVSIYDNLNDIYDLKLGQSYNRGQFIGDIKRIYSHIPVHLHFAIAFGGTWDLHIKDSRTTPLNAGPTWMKARYLDPVQFLETKFIKPQKQEIQCKYL